MSYALLSADPGRRAAACPLPESGRRRPATAAPRCAVADATSSRERRRRCLPKRRGRRRPTAANGRAGSDDRDDDPDRPGERPPQDRPDIAADIGVLARVRDDENQAVHSGADDISDGNPYTSFFQHRHSRTPLYRMHRDMPLYPNVPIIASPKGRERLSLPPLGLIGRLRFNAGRSARYRGTSPSSLPRPARRGFRRGSRTCSGPSSARR